MVLPKTVNVALTALKYKIVTKIDMTTSVGCWFTKNLFDTLLLNDVTVLDGRPMKCSFEGCTSTGLTPQEFDMKPII